MFEHIFTSVILSPFLAVRVKVLDNRFNMQGVLIDNFKNNLRNVYGIKRQ